MRKSGKPSLRRQQPPLFPAPVSPPHLLCFLLFLSFPSPHHLYFSSYPAAFTVYIYSHLLYLPYMPSASPFTHNIHPSPPVPRLHPHKTGYKFRGKFIRSKNKHVSVSVLLPCRVPQGCAMLWMGPVCSPRLWPAQTPQSAHTLKRTLESSYHFYSPALLLPLNPPQANLALVPSCGFTTERMGLRTRQQ